MKILLPLFVFVSLVSGCASGWNSDVSDTPPHNRLINTTWTLKTNAYVVAYEDNRKDLIIIPNVRSLSTYLNYTIIGKPYDESNVGKRFGGAKVLGGFRAGEQLQIVSVIKNSHFEMGTTYHPMMVPAQSSRWTGDKELDGEFLYEDFEEQGTLNPDYAVKVE
jgi:hypothetical protein